MSAPRRLGVLGGMGPEATALPMSRLIAPTPAEDDADHVPLVVDTNPQAPSRLEAPIEGAPTLDALDVPVAAIVAFAMGEGQAPEPGGRTDALQKEAAPAQ